MKNGIAINAKLFTPLVMRWATVAAAGKKSIADTMNKKVDIPIANEIGTFKNNRRKKRHNKKTTVIIVAPVLQVQLGFCYLEKIRR
jgi:hypothetical protein